MKSTTKTIISRGMVLTGILLVISGLIKLLVLRDLGSEFIIGVVLPIAIGMIGILAGIALRRLRGRDNY